MNSSPAMEPDAPDLVCQFDNVQGMVDALSCVRWKRHQLFTNYEYGAEGRPRFGISLGLLVDCLNTFSSPGHSNTIEIKYPGPDMELLLKSVDTLNSCIYSEIRTRIPETTAWDYNFEQARTAPLTFTVKSAALKEAIDDLEWPGSSVTISLKNSPPCVTFKGEGHGDLQIDFMYYANTDLLLAFHCDTEVSYGYKYKFLKATTANIPGNVVREQGKQIDNWKRRNVESSAFGFGCESFSCSTSGICGLSTAKSDCIY